MSAELALKGCRILVTRAAEQAGVLASRLERHGARVHVLPVVAIEPPLDEEPLRRALAEPARFDWIVFTSQNAVAAVARLAPAAALAACRVAAVGKATAAALHEYGLRVDLIPPTALAESLLQALAELEPNLAHRAFLLPRAAEGREVLPEGLRQRGAAVTLVEAYRTVPSVEHRDALNALLQNALVDAVTFTAASAVRAFDALLTEAVRRQVRALMPVFCLGPVVYEAARQLGYKVQTIGPSYDLDGLTSRLLEAGPWLSGRRARP